MKKPMVRSDSASEAKWRPKQPRKICLKNFGLSSVNEFQTAKTVQKSTDFRSTIWAVCANDHSPMIQC